MSAVVTERRLAAVREALVRHEPPLDALVVASPVNRRYLTGFTGTAGTVVISPYEAVFLTDFRYMEQAAEQARGYRVVQTGDKPLEDLARQLSQLGASRVGFEREHLTVGQFERMRAAAPDLEWVPTERLVERVRMVKDETELAAIRRAAQIADAALESLLPEVREGVSERDLALELEFRMRRAGASGAAFEFIVASGPRSALPHGTASDRRLRRGDFVTFDFGAVADGYCSDCTRTVVLGKADDDQRRIYGIVRDAQQAALEAVRAGVAGRAVDEAARSRIEAAGHGERFGHSTGHGVGLQVHEGPGLGRLSEDVLAPGMVVTVEPGIYVSGWGGVRIEDLVIVREDGAEVLTRITKELLEL